MPVEGLKSDMIEEKKSGIKNTESKPVALILAGYDKVDSEAKRRRKKEQLIWD